MRGLDHVTLLNDAECAQHVPWLDSGDARAGDGRAQTSAHKKTAFSEGETRFLGLCGTTTGE